MFAIGCVPLILHVIGNFFCNEDTKRFHSSGEMIVFFFQKEKIKINFQFDYYLKIWRNFN
jgi:hypothetical protein